MHAMGERSFHAEYIKPRMVKDYKSVLQVTEEGRLMKEATIEVNKPLYYSGYHFYQNTFAFDNSGPVSGIQVVSARGVWLVFIGYALILIGIVMQFGSKLRKGTAS
jgi:cytochrome c biogenesis protein ResB